ncbi:MAG: hypothetical protein AB2417_02785 [Clostridiaceae bacterium]
MQIRTELIDGKKRIIVTKEASGIDKTKEAVLKVMGPGWEYKKE